MKTLLQYLAPFCLVAFSIDVPLAHLQKFTLYKRDMRNFIQTLIYQTSLMELTSLQVLALLPIISLKFPQSQ